MALLRESRRRGGSRSSAFSPPALAHLDDRTVENDVCVALGQLPRLLDLVDLRVTGDQNGRCTRLPSQNRLRPERRVVPLARLRPEDRQLATCGSALDEVD